MAHPNKQALFKGATGLILTTEISNKTRFYNMIECDQNFWVNPQNQRWRYKLPVYSLNVEQPI